MGNECSADCGRRPQGQPEKPRRTVGAKDPSVEVHTKAMAVHRQQGDWRTRYQPSQERELATNQMDL